MKVSFIIPIIRPEKAKRCIEAIKENAGVPESDYEIIAEEDKERIGCPKMVKKLVEKTRGEMVCFLGDDTIPQKDFLKHAVKAMEANPEGWGLVSFNDNPHTSRSAAHWLAHKKLLPHLDHEFFHTGYSHCYCDDELLIRCQQMNRYIYAYNAYIHHDHPAVQGGDVKDDPEYSKIYDNERMEKDHQLFLGRMRRDFKPIEEHKGKIKNRIAIGLLTNDTICIQTALCLNEMVIYTHMQNPKLEIVIANPQASIVEIGRNNAVEYAKQFKADKLFFIDSDMTFPKETLLRLLSHKKPIVCCDAVRRRPPYSTVVKDINGQPLDHTKDLDELVELRGVSTACTLIDMGVFDRIELPYFLVPFLKDAKGGSSFIGEDFYFSLKAHKQGLKVYCDTKLSRQIGHIGSRPFFIDDFIEAKTEAKQA